MKVIVRCLFHNGIHFSACPFYFHAWNTGGFMRRMDGHGPDGIQGYLFGLVFSPNHFVSIDLGFAGVDL